MKLKLLCLPYAGGSAASIYLSWKKKLQNHIQVVPLELAGRGRRIQEPLINSLNTTINDLIKLNIDILQDESQPYAIFGHSMGGLLAYEFCQRIHDLSLHPPEKLIVSAFQPPDIKLEGNYHLLSIDEFAEKMKKNQNIPSTIFEDPTMYKVFIPILYSDYQLVFKYQFAPKKQLMNTDLILFTGIKDYSVYQNRKGWASHTNGSFLDAVFDGGHFFIRENEQEVLDKIHEIFSDFPNTTFLK